MARRSHSGNKSDVRVDDGHLIGLVRSGDMSAFDHLYQRHISIASTVARRNVDNPSDAEDVVAEAFQSVLRSLVAGKGPDMFFRAYLLSTVTRLSHQQNRKSSKVLPSGEESILDQTVTEPDAAVNAFESSTVAQAFKALPERWQAVLWYLDVERMKPAVVAPILGLSANAVSALAVRAREGLRRQYLQFHLSESAADACTEFASKLGHFIRGGLSSAAELKVRGHLKGCAKCTAALADLKDVQGTMRAVLLPLATGIPLAVWVGKGAGLGVLGGILPVKGFLALPALAQPVVMALTTAAAVGLVLGAAGMVDILSPDTPWGQQASETGMVQMEAGTWSPTPTSAPTPAGPVAAEQQPLSAAPSASAPIPALPPPAAAAPPPAAAAPPPAGAAPTAPVGAVAIVTATVKRNGTPDRGQGKGASGSVREITFTASGTNALGKGKAVFSVETDARIDAGSINAPTGWWCSTEGPNLVSCETDSVQRNNLHFLLNGAPKGQKGNGVIKYSISGAGLATGSFECDY